MSPLSRLQDAVEAIRANTSENIPSLAINILLSIGLEPGLSREVLARKLDADVNEINYGVQLLTYGDDHDFRYAELLQEDQDGSLFLTVKADSIVGGFFAINIENPIVKENMKNAYFTSEYGKEIFALNFSYDVIDEAIPLIEECAQQVRQRPEKSVLTLTIIEKGKFTTELVDKLKGLTKGNAPYVRKAAVVGVTGLYRVVMNAIRIFSKRDFKLFDTKEEAVKYLVQD